MKLLKTERVKFIDPLMGTETTQTLRPYRRIVAVVKFIDPLMGTETKYQPITNECMPHYVKLNNPPDGDGNIAVKI